jgi:4-hydroxy 2-oxovalerate aldolase
MFQGRDVLILGKGASGVRHSDAIEEFIRERQPIVVVLNLENIISESLINFHIACHPVRLLADASVHKNEQWDLICPYSQLPADIQSTLDRNRVIDIGINIEPGTFGTTENGCIVPNNLVLSYALACAASGASGQIFLAGLDGYPPGDLRNQEVETSFKIFKTAFPGSEPVSITPTTYRECGRMSVYGF